MYLRIGVDMIASSEEPLPQSGLGVSNRPPAGTDHENRPSPREPAPASIPRTSPADLPPLRGCTLLPVVQKKRRLLEG